MIIYKDEKFGFFEIFNERNGTLIRSDDFSGNDPVMRSYPELLDVGIMGHCESGLACKTAGIDCYQNAHTRKNPNMLFADFSKIVRQSIGKTFQIALGGAGDPNKHPDFERILKLCRQYGIVPNLTTSGNALSDKEVKLIKEYCGAVAVSWYSRLDKDGRESNQMTLDAVNRFVNIGCVTNIHFVISRDTIEEATFRLNNDLFPKNINAVIFILYKPVGQGIIGKTLARDDSRLNAFVQAVQKSIHPYRIGFDTCFTPLLLHHMGNMTEQSIDACEAATFSMYIDSELNCFPCSFGVDFGSGISESMSDKTIREIWNGNLFTEFRSRQKAKCSGCSKSRACRMGCRLNLPIDLC